MGVYTKNLVYVAYSVVLAFVFVSTAHASVIFEGFENNNVGDHWGQTGVPFNNTYGGLTYYKVGDGVVYEGIRGGYSDIGAYGAPPRRLVINLGTGKNELTYYVKLENVGQYGIFCQRFGTDGITGICFNVFTNLDAPYISNDALFGTSFGAIQDYDDRKSNWFKMWLQWESVAGGYNVRHAFQEQGNQSFASTTAWEFVNSDIFATNLVPHLYVQNTNGFYFDNFRHNTNVINFEQPAKPLYYVEILGGDEITTASTTFDISIEYALSGSYNIGVDLIEYAISGGISTTTTQEITQIGTQTRVYTFTLPTGTTYNIRAWADNVFTGERLQDTAVLHVVSPSGEWLFKGETWQDIECSISDLTGCFKKALFWAFVPTTGIGQDFLNLWEEVKTKPPIGYITLSAQLLSGMSEGEGEYDLEVIAPLQDNIFTPFKNATTTVFFVLSGFYIFKRTTNFNI